MRGARWVLWVVMLSWIAAVAQAAPPLTMSFQARVLSGNNLLSDGVHAFGFTLYGPSGNALWSEAQSLTTLNGLVNAMLGSATPLPSTGWDSSYTIGMTIDAGPELSPRYALSSSPYSLDNKWLTCGPNMITPKANESYVITGSAISGPQVRLYYGDGSSPATSPQGLAVRDSVFVAGTGYGWASSRAAIRGGDNRAQSYELGVAGYSTRDFPHTAGVLGADWLGTQFGALAYRDSAGTNWAGFFGGGVAANVNVNGALWVRDSAWIGGEPLARWTWDVGTHVMHPTNNLQVHIFPSTQDTSCVWITYGDGGSHATGATGLFVLDRTGTAGLSDDYTGARATIKGADNFALAHEYGVAGYSHQDAGRTGGVIGADWSAAAFGALGYKDSANTRWGGFFGSTTSGAGAQSNVAVEGYVFVRDSIRVNGNLVLNGGRVIMNPAHRDTAGMVAAFGSGVAPIFLDVTPSPLTDGTNTFAFIAPADAGVVEVDVDLMTARVITSGDRLWLQLWDGSAQVGPLYAYLPPNTSQFPLHARWAFVKNSVTATTYTVRAYYSGSGDAYVAANDVGAYSTMSWAFHPR